jgi:hypothetical protein
MRICPNSECSALVFVAEEVGSPRTVFPPEVIDFDATNLPPRILASLEEAVKSHAAGCYRASALMVRRVLEELCEDKKATGTNLMQRLGALVWRGDLGGTCATIWMGLLCRGRCQFSTMIDAGKRSLVF